MDHVLVLALPSRTEHAGVDKVEQTEVLGQVVLDGGAGQDNSAGRLEVVECLERLALRVLQAVALM